MSEGRLVAEDTPDALKSALGDETLWLEADDPADLADRLQARLGLDARVVGESVHVSHPQAHQLLGRVYEAFPGRVESATVRRPTLEDVYVVHTGHGLLDPADPAPETGSVQRS
jgi:ABC-2 type transport system ATP-binding protein